MSHWLPPQNRKVRQISLSHYAVTEKTGLEVTLWTCIRKVLGMNLGQGAGYPDRDFSWFLVVFLNPYRKMLVYYLD
jgi:hypothetical protein